MWQDKYLSGNSIELEEQLVKLEKVNRPIPFCQYCSLDAWSYEEAWAPSRQDRYDWIEFEWTQPDIQYLKKAVSVYVYGAGEIGAKTISRLKKNGIAINAVLVGNEDENLGSVLGVPVMAAQDVKLEGGVCLLAVDDSEKTKAGRTVSQCGFKQVIPLYLY